MKRIHLALFVAALLLPVPVTLADDPPARGENTPAASNAGAATKEATPAPMEGATRTIQVEEIPNGAASMEPTEKESPEERSERAFIENVWNSP